MNRRAIAISISGVIILFATIIISVLCIDDWSGLTGWAFGVMLWSEIVFFGGLVLVEWAAEKTEQIIIRSSIYALISAYTAVNIPVSVLYIAFFKEAIISFAIIEIVLLSIIVIAISVFLAASNGVRQSSENIMANRMNIELMIERLNKLAVEPGCDAYSSVLKRLSDDLRFSGLSTSVSEDVEIDKAISAIEIEIGGEGETSSEGIKATMIRLNSLIAQRKLAAGAAKKGRV